MRLFFSTFISFVLFSFQANATAPINACRVNTETIQKYGTLISNAGCVISKNENGKISFLMVLNDNGPNDNGWAFPGGKPSTNANDLKEKGSLLQPSSLQYEEPAVCTASREAREETGSEVIVGDLVDKQDKFIAFNCYLLQPDKVSNKGNPEEIKEIKWISFDEIKWNKVKLRFQSNLSIATAATKQIQNKK
ncbi:MAG: hypothetical protein A3F16_08800 [Deltaproteobacteria bacterium RIFCSPHIGHO2_12_FULL_43_9]|nr:MAG: hypothetical protein A3F16_08800 [Deltaproteobacteria bacterium RIFCSPHIGHO2_12_FULL_43_9]